MTTLVLVTVSTPFAALTVVGSNSDVTVSVIVPRFSVVVSVPVSVNVLNEVNVAAPNVVVVVTNCWFWIVCVETTGTVMIPWAFAMWTGDVCESWPTRAPSAASSTSARERTSLILADYAFSASVCVCFRGVRTYLFLLRTMPGFGWEGARSSSPSSTPNPTDRGARQIHASMGARLHY